jgi:glycosyltransferase involved in cell wall biosynthesis
VLTGRPSVTILIPTYARSALLREAIASALMQDYKGPFSVIVLNDCRQQFLTCRDYRVTCINTHERFGSLGAKRNKMLTLGSNSWVVWLDDDDLLMPWHLSRLVDSLQQRDGLGAVFCKHIIRYEQQRWSWNDVPGGINGILVDTHFAFACGGFNDHLNVGEDNDFRAKMLARGGRIAYAPGPSYVYRVDAPVFHVSKSLEGTDVDMRKFDASAESRFLTGEEPKGHVEIIPALSDDYESLFRSSFPNDVPVK